MSIGKKKLAVTMTSLAGVIIFAVIVIIVNRLFNPVNVRMDFTDGKIYTLSEGTRQILQGLDKHVSIRFYYSRDVAGMPVYLKTYASRVEDLLDEYKRLGGKNLDIKKLNPKPDSDEEDSANMDAVTGHATDAMDGDRIYLGIAVSCAGKMLALPFLSPDKEALLEYDLTRAISQVQVSKKSRVGVMSAMQVMGGIDNPQAMMMGQGGMKPAWAVINELKQSFEVVEVPPTSEAIGADIDLLLLVHPKEVGEATMFAIDQYVLSGGRLLAFVDPLCMVDMQNQQQQQYMPPMPSTLGPLFSAWGVNFESSQVVVDRKLATRIRTGQAGPDVLPTVISLGKSEISSDDPATSALNNMLVFCAGAFTGDPAEGLIKTVLLNSSEDVQLMESFMTQRNGEDILRSFRSDERKKDLAIKLTGNFKSAFPQGKPGESADEGADKEVAADHLTVSSKPGAVVLVADADMLYDAFCVSTTNIFGQKIVQPINDNLNFALNMVENLLGDSRLFAIRSRATTSRPFTKVRDLQADAEKRFQDKISRIESDLRKVQQDINDLQRKRQKGERELLSREQRELLTQFRKKEAEAKQELKSVRKQLRQDIDSLENNIMAVNIALMPVLVIIGGVVLAIIKRRRNVRQ